jgi:hypothetical protein
MAIESSLWTRQALLLVGQFSMTKILLNMANGLLMEVTVQVELQKQNIGLQV